MPPFSHVSNEEARLSQMTKDIKKRNDMLYDETYTQALEDVMNKTHARLNQIREINMVFAETIWSNKPKPLVFNIDDAMNILFHLEQDRMTRAND